VLAADPGHVVPEVLALGLELIHFAAHLAEGLLHGEEAGELLLEP
jgi:hypothetical protein